MCSISRNSGAFLILLAGMGAGAIALSTFLNTPSAMAVSEPPKDAPKDAAKPADAHGDAEMEKWMEMNKVGAEHKVLDFMTGTWTCTMTFKMTPDAPPSVSNGEQTNAWSLDNRFQKTDFKGEMGPGMTFTGIGFTGYNTARKTYESTWMDSTTNGMMMSTGSYNSATKTLNMSGECDDMMTGKREVCRSEYVNTGPDSYVLKMYDNAPDGKEFLSLEIKYTRKK